MLPPCQSRTGETGMLIGTTLPLNCLNTSKLTQLALAGGTPELPCQTWSSQRSPPGPSYVEPNLTNYRQEIKRTVNTIRINHLFAYGVGTADPQTVQDTPAPPAPITNKWQLMTAQIKNNCN